jgi:hypothetical protein
MPADEKLRGIFLKTSDFPGREHADSTSARISVGDDFSSFFHRGDEKSPLAVLHSATETKIDEH